MPREKSPRNARRATMITWGVTFVLVAVTVAVALYAQTRETEDSPLVAKKLANVEVMTVSPEPYSEMLTLPARVSADRVAAVSSEFGGTLARWLAAEGAAVSIGDVVAELDLRTISANREELEASLQSAMKNVSLARIGRESASVSLANARKQKQLQELALSAAQSDLELARIEFDRTRKLVERKVMDPAKLDTARNALTQAELAAKRAEASLASASLGVKDAEVLEKRAAGNLELAGARVRELEAAMESIEVQVSKTFLRAPISGRLEEHLVEPGEVVDKGVPLAFVYDLAYVRATINVPDRYVAFLDPDNPATRLFLSRSLPGAESRVRARLIIPGLPKLTGGNAGELSFDAEIARIAQAADPESNTYKVELRLPNPGGAIRHGLIARGRIEYLHYTEAVVIPIRAVQVTDEGPRVLVVERKNDAERVGVRDIEAISIREDRLLVGSGISPGERLIVAGWKGLVSGEAVNVLVQDGRFTVGGAGAPAAAGESGE